MRTTGALPIPRGLELRHSSGALAAHSAPDALESSRGLPHSKTLPRISPLLLRWFTWYCRGYIRRHFHSLRVARAGFPPDTHGLPLVIYTNHASWWDPLVGLVIKAECFPDRSLYTPIDAAMLERYKMFAKLGFFGVEQNSRRGVVHFLRTSEAVLASPDRVLAITPQSRFADVRERPVRFQPGLGHLASRVPGAMFLPVATEYVFWEERLPEVLIRFGEPVRVTPKKSKSVAADSWTTLFEQRMSETQNALALEAQGRNPDAFKTILQGGAGQGGVYDLWRALQSKWRGEHFSKEHGLK